MLVLPIPWSEQGGCSRNRYLNGLEDRRRYLRKAKDSLAAIDGLRVAFEEGGATVVLHRGAFGDGVEKLQQLLSERGFDLTVDGDFGPATELAVRLFQRQCGLEEDGIAGRKTWAALREQ